MLGKMFPVVTECFGTRKPRFKLYPPNNVNIDSYDENLEPVIPVLLSEIGVQKILDHIDVVHNPYTDKVDFIIDQQLTEALNYNQRYILVCNFCWIMMDLIGEPVSVMKHIKPIFGGIIAELANAEIRPGDFGQTVDFKDSVNPNDFGLRDHE